MTPVVWLGAAIPSLPTLIPRDLARARRYGARMLEMRPDCERCGVDLPADAGGAFICSLECTYCADCADELDERCPGCGGELLDRPARVGATLKKFPAATERRHRG